MQMIESRRHNVVKEIYPQRLNHGSEYLYGKEGTYVDHGGPTMCPVFNASAWWGGMMGTLY